MQTLSPEIIHTFFEKLHKEFMDDKYTGKNSVAAVKAASETLKMPQFTGFTDAENDILLRAACCLFAYTDDRKRLPHENWQITESDVFSYAGLISEALKLYGYCHTFYHTLPDEFRELMRSRADITLSQAVMCWLSEYSAFRTTETKVKNENTSEL